MIVLPQNILECLAPRKRREKLARPLVGGLSKWLTAEQAADYLQVETRTILAWARLGQLKAHPLSGTKRKVWRFLLADLDGMLTPPSVAEPRRVQ